MCSSLFRSLTFLIASSCGYFLAAQDLIVTTAGDSIHCTITIVNGKRLYYTNDVNGAGGRGNIAWAEVAQYRRKGFAPVVVAGQAPEHALSTDRYRAVRDTLSGPRWAVGAEYSWCARVGRIADLEYAWEEHLKDLLKGTEWAGWFSYRIRKNVSIGANVRSGTFGAQANDLPFYTSEDTLLRDVDTKVTIGSAGPTVTFNVPFPASDAWIGLIVSGGLTWVRYDFQVDNEKILLNGEDLFFGTTALLGVDLTRNISLMGLAGIELAAVDQFRVTTVGTSAPILLGDQKESLFRYRYGVRLGVRF